jgi:hypothetical protein
MIYESSDNKLSLVSIEILLELKKNQIKKTNGQQHFIRNETYLRSVSFKFRCINANWPVLINVRMKSMAVH